MAVGTAKAAAERRQQKLAEEKRASMIITAILVFAVVLLGFWITTFAPVSSQATLPDKAGEPRKISNLFLASSLCQKQAGINYRGNLVNAVTDDFSTRHDYPRDLFVVLLLVSVYEPAKRTMEYRVHCHVIPNDTVVNYFKGFIIER
jgi:hypothetical protein